jgi:serine/threonine protein phosphatase PrpC
MSAVHYVSKKGLRKSNEDSHSIYTCLDKGADEPNINLYAVYDGHGGKYVSNYLSKNLPGCFVHPKVSYPLRKNYVNGIYDAIEKELYRKHTDHVTECGSTCLVVCHYRVNGKEYIDVMNTGDSRLVACNKSFISTQITLDHKPSTPLEKRRLQRLGARIDKELWCDRGTWRINDLSVSRAFGDKASEKYVVCKPDLYTHQITNNLEFIIIGCDGLWDVVSNQEAVDMVIDNCYDCDMKRIENPKETVKSSDNSDLNIADMLANYAIKEKGSDDNVTIIVVFFN